MCDRNNCGKGVAMEYHVIVYNSWGDSSSVHITVKGKFVGRSPVVPW
jgi:hypothetical protein